MERAITVGNQAPVASILNNENHYRALITEIKTILHNPDLSDSVGFSIWESEAGTEVLIKFPNGIDNDSSSPTLLEYVFDEDYDTLLNELSEYKLRFITVELEPVYNEDGELEDMQPECEPLIEEVDISTASFRAGNFQGWEPSCSNGVQSNSDWVSSRDEDYRTGGETEYSIHFSLISNQLARVIGAFLTGGPN